MNVILKNDIGRLNQINFFTYVGKNLPEKKVSEQCATVWKFNIFSAAQF